MNAKFVKMIGFCHAKPWLVRTAVRSPQPVPWLLAVFLLLPSLVFAQCYAVYDEAYRNTFKNSFHVQLPSRAGNFSSMAECRSMVDQMLADPQYRYDAGLHKTQCVCDGGEGGSSGYSGGHAPSGGSFQQQIVTMAVSKLLNALLSGINAPDGSDGDAIRQKLQKQWDDEEAARKIAEKKRLDEIFKAAQQNATALLGNRPAGTGRSTEVAASEPVYLGMGTVPALLRSSGAVTEAEWAEARAWQTRIDALREKGVLTAAESKELASLEVKRNALWKRATSVPDLTQRDRNGLRLKLRTVNNGAVIASTSDLMDVREAASRNPKEVPTGVISTMTEASLTFGIQSAIETAGEGKMDDIGNAFVGKEKKVTKFGNALFLADAGTAVVSGKPEETAGPAVTWVSGKVVEKAPWLGFRVGMAQGVSTVTTSVARNAFEQIVETSGKIVPGFLPPGMTGKEWWESMKSELALPQKFGMEGFGQ